VPRKITIFHPWKLCESARWCTNLQSLEQLLGELPPSGEKNASIHCCQEKRGSYFVVRIIEQQHRSPPAAGRCAKKYQRARGSLGSHGSRFQGLVSASRPALLTRLDIIEHSRRTGFSRNPAAFLRHLGCMNLEFGCWDRDR
jgi:hypothetical protein